MKPKRLRRLQKAVEYALELLNDPCASVKNLDVSAKAHLKEALRVSQRKPKGGKRPM